VGPPDSRLNPDCGFGTFSNRPVNSPMVAAKKLSVMAQAAAQLRQRYRSAA
jgi:5-methyltetrahydropteroyltriglutamate--homocysteine methyltransferase